ncbi:MAG: hypothetical protein ACLUR5_06800 [Eubacterium ventriosum]
MDKVPIGSGRGTGEISSERISVVGVIFPSIIKEVTKEVHCLQCLELCKSSQPLQKYR